jgi:hypothetical protein
MLSLYKHGVNCLRRNELCQQALLALVTNTDAASSLDIFVQKLVFYIIYVYDKHIEKQ